MAQGCSGTVELNLGRKARPKRANAVARRVAGLSSSSAMRSTAGRAALEEVLEAGEESLPSLTRIVCVLLAVQSLVPLNPSDPAVAGHDPPRKQ
jgi:hypothetical protein